MNTRGKQGKGRKTASRQGDANYHPSQASSRKRQLEKDSTPNLLAARSNTATQLDDLQPVKTTMLIESGVMTAQVSETSLQENLCANLSIIPSHRPVAAITVFSAMGSPMQTETPAGKTRLSRVAKYGPVSLFSNVSSLFPALPAQRDMKLENDFYASPQYQAIKKIVSDVKFQEVIITPELLQESSREHHKRGKRRVASQQRVMVEEGISEKHGSATNYVEATQLFSDTIKWEWLHLVAHAILDKQSQQPGNLVAGTAHANTDMLFIESEIAYLASAYPEGFTLQVRASLIEGTHIAKQIEYRIETDDFTLPLIFDAQNPQQPHISFKDYMHLTLKALVEAHKYQTALPTSSAASAAASAATPFVFFQRPEAGGVAQHKDSSKLDPSKPIR